MIRPLSFALAALLLLASCAPSASSSNYAEQISENFFRLPDTFSMNGIRKQKRTVVPVKPGQTVLVERPSTTEDGIIALTSTRRKSAPIVYDETEKYVIAELIAPQGWTASINSVKKVVEFDSSVRLDAYHWVDMGGNYELKGTGMIRSSNIISFTVPEDTQPGRYRFRAQYEAEGKKYPPSIEFIAEVL